MKENSKKVLIVDDDEEFLKVCSLFLEDNYNVLVHSCSTGKYAAKHLNQDDNYDLVFLDVCIPDMSGIDIFRKIEKDHPHLKDKIVFVTGAVLDDEMKKIVNDVNSKILERPFDLANLGQLLDSVKKS